MLRVTGHETGNPVRVGGSAGANPDEAAVNSLVRAEAEPESGYTVQVTFDR